MHPAELHTRKAALRQQARAKRLAQSDRPELSRRILATAAARPEYAAARTVLFYVDRRDEVQTRPLLATALASEKRIVVPYCQADELILFQLESMEELEPATFGILEPRRTLRTLAARRVDPGELDLVFVPGLAFDPRGARLGYGRGYFDRLLCRVRADTPLIALAFQCQVFPELPSHELDVPMHLVITEQQVYDCR
jgi:5-formyltetrahydrofolate cyclo-ligase